MRKLIFWLLITLISVVGIGRIIETQKWYYQEGFRTQHPPYTRTFK